MAFWRRRSQKDFEAEVEAHLAIEADERMASGATAADARVEARRAFGNVTKATERFYDSRRPAALETAARNVRYALRTLRRNPGFTIAAVATLAFGVGVNTSVFAFLYTLSVKPLPVRDADRLVSVFREYHGRFTREVRGFRIRALSCRVCRLSRPESHVRRDFRLSHRNAGARSHRTVAGQRPARFMRLSPDARRPDGDRAAVHRRRVRAPGQRPGRRAESWVLAPTVRR